MTEGRIAERAPGIRIITIRARRWAVAAVLLLAACSPAERERVQHGPASDPPAGAQVMEDIERGTPGGSLVMGMAGEPKTFNPLLSTDVLSTAVSDLLFARLFDYDRHAQKFMPGVAERWEYDEASMSWVFHLREGARWSDGVPLTADDFLFAAEAILDPSVGSHYRDLLEVEGKPFTFEAPDPQTFVARIPAVDSTAFIQLINVQALPRHKHGEALASGTFPESLHLDTAAEEIVTSGPFVVKAYRPGDRLIFAPNPHYFRFDKWGQRLPYLEEYVLLSVPSFDAMALRFQAGDLDLLEDPIQAQNLKTLQDGQERGGYTLHNPGLSLRNTHYWFNLKPGGTYVGEGGRRIAWEPDDPKAEPPEEIRARDFRYYVDPQKRSWFENVLFRRACSMATNREAMARTVFYGQAEPLYGFESPANRAWNYAPITRFPYDPAKAGELLDRIGFVDRNGDGIRQDPEGRPIRFTLITNRENQARERMAVLLMEDFRKVGFDVTLQLLDFNNIITRIQDSYDYEACLLGLASGVPPHPADAANIWLSRSRMHQWNPAQKTPATAWEAQIDELYAEFRNTFDEARQKIAYDEMQMIWAENQPMIHLVVDQLWVAASDRIGNLKPSLLRPHLTHNIETLYLKPGK